jgi:hypothetical protein
MGDRGTYLATMIALASVAFGIIAALAWNTFITDVIKMFLPAQKGLIPEFIYAAVVTVLAVLVMSSLGKLAERTGGKSTI